MQKIFNADYKLALPLLLLFLFLLSGFIPAEHNQAARKASEHAIVQASGSIGDNSDGDDPTDGVATDSVPDVRTTFWLTAASVFTPTGDNFGRRLPGTSPFAEFSCGTKRQAQFEFKNTLSLVDSGLGTLFTLVGEKPSGTS